MKTPLLLLSIVLLIISSACRDSGEAQVPTELVGTWKCVGFGNTQTNQIRAIEPSDCKECYTLTLKTDWSFEGHTSTNEVLGKFYVETRKESFFIESLGGTEINELLDGKSYVEIITKLKRFSISKDELRLVDGKENILIYKRK